MAEIEEIGAEDKRLPWIEPESRRLAVAETANYIGMGHDGETFWPDCTAS